MSQTIQGFSLRRNFGLAMAFIIALVLMLDRVYEYAVVRPQDIDREYSTLIRELGYSLSRDYGNLLNSGDLNGLRLSVSGRATSHLISSLLVADPAGNVIASLRSRAARGW